MRSSRRQNASGTRGSEDAEGDSLWLADRDGGAEDDGDAEGIGGADGITDPTEPFNYILTSASTITFNRSCHAETALSTPSGFPNESDASAWTLFPPGLRETLAFLRRDSESSRVFAFAEWMLLRPPPAPQLALSIFTRPLRRIEIPLPRIVEYLSQASFAAASSDPKASVLRSFLEHAVYELGHLDVSLHTRLATEYISVVLKLRGGTSSGKSTTPDFQKIASVSSALLTNELMLGGSTSQRPVPGSEGGTLGPLRAKLMHLLQVRRWVVDLWSRLLLPCAFCCVYFAPSPLLLRPLIPWCRRALLLTLRLYWQ